MEVKKWTCLCLLAATKLRKDSCNGLALCISNGSKTVACNASYHQAREVGDDETDASTAKSTYVAPPGGMSLDFRTQKLYNVYV
jgi:hypothetical protein